MRKNKKNARNYANSLGESSAMFCHASFRRRMSNLILYAKCRNARCGSDRRTCVNIDNRSIIPGLSGGRRAGLLRCAIFVVACRWHCRLEFSPNRSEPSFFRAGELGGTATLSCLSIRRRGPASSSERVSEDLAAKVVNVVCDHLIKSRSKWRHAEPIFVYRLDREDNHLDVAQAGRRSSRRGFAFGGTIL